MFLSPISGVGVCVQELAQEEGWGRARGGGGTWAEPRAWWGVSSPRAGHGARFRRGGAGSLPSRVVVVAALAGAVDPLQLVQAMPAARVEYIAPWWVVWLHSVPHLGLRLQRVDSTFSPGDETYQEVSP